MASPGFRRGEGGVDVKWDAFFGRKKEAGDRDREEIRSLIRRIEKSAPREYRRDRAVRYYHYEQIPAYVLPLKRLLEAVADREAFVRDEGEAVQGLFLHLRPFYDIRGRLSLEEAVQDRRLRKKLTHLVTIFYGRKDVCGDKLSRMLEPLREAGEQS